MVLKNKTVHFGLKKALLISAFFIALKTFLFPSTGWAADNCQLPGPWQSAALAKVLDGDTLLLETGEKVRLIGINTPEHATEKRRAEPFAKQATRAVKVFFNNQHTIKLQRGREPKDHYGRTLAYVARSDGMLLSEYLVSYGLAFYLAIPPNLQLLPCLMKAERQARRQQTGLWEHYQPITVQNIKQAGFSLVAGKVEKVSQAANGVWIDLVGKLTLFIPRNNLKYFSRSSFDQIKGRQVEVRGWLIDRSAGGRKLKKGRKRWMMKVSHPAAIIFK
ncbi:thermonuclease family protein [Spartinivicinus poritis]|uniref:Thermonuclease family protein n=1 Tax=Spartinivicinus poritis TaxID=2994640 RepID=A0ABT5U5X3_9GAMM|nr:thermonuclease family protein [Spartinivicinus sp. A2-2]MDE1461763.1 thermonuclease family protein [Spartinivicinus sp. A2-2]